MNSASIVTATFLASAASGAAGIITFDGYTPRNVQDRPVDIQDFRFEGDSTFHPGVWDFGSSPSFSTYPYPPIAFNGTPYLVFAGSPLSFGRIDDDRFFLESLQVGLSWYATVDPDSSATATITSTLAGGGTSSLDVALDGSFRTFFVGLDVTSVIISSPLLSSGYLALENVVIDDGFLAVPEPPTSAWVAASLLGIAGWALRNRMRHC